MIHFTLTSDFGSQNFAIASVKGKIYQAVPDCRITSISNHITPFNLQQAAYVFKQSYRHFPPGTFHLIYNDLYAKAQHRLLYAYENQQHIFCADNGFMTLLFDDSPVQLYTLLEQFVSYNYLTVTDAFLSTISNIIHNQSAQLANIDVSTLEIKHAANATLENNALEAQVLHIDHFGNVVVNVTRQQFEESRNGRKFKILFMRNEEINQLSNEYSDVPIGHKLCFFNTANYLEIAINKGNAASLFGFQVKNERNIFYQNIKIFFE